jgi:hypothetical protein
MRGRAYRDCVVLAVILAATTLTASCQEPRAASTTSSAEPVASSAESPAEPATPSTAGLAPGAAESTGARSPRELPRGGTTIFPRYRVVAFYGTAGTASLGVLGEGQPAEAATRLEGAAAAFATPDRVIQPAMELIATVADRKPGPDGDYSHDIDAESVWRYLEVARAHRQLLVLDIQPGRSGFLEKARKWEPLLREPDVGLALDPEWRMPPGQVPGHSIGHAMAAEINEVAAWLAELTRNGQLPQKLLVLHQFTRRMLPDVEAVSQHPELAIVQHIDGFGSPAEKLAKYRSLQQPHRFNMGFKLFYDEDTPMLNPPQTLALSPPPDYVSYQ